MNWLKLKETIAKAEVKVEEILSIWNQTKVQVFILPIVSNTNYNQYQEGSLEIIKMIQFKISLILIITNLFILKIKFCREMRLIIL